MSPQQMLHHAHQVVQGLVQNSNIKAGETVPTRVATTHLSPAAPRSSVLLVAQAVGWLLLHTENEQLKNVTLTQAGYDAGLTDPEYQPVGIGVYRDDDGDIIAVLVRHPDGTLEIVALDDYTYDPPTRELPDVPEPGDLKNEHRRTFGM